MSSDKKWIAMILAGGQGSRLGPLTKRLAKPAVPFGGKYRIIDFALSNCVNSGLDTVGVLTQYQPLLLNEYLGRGQPWDLDRMNGGLFVLPPYRKKSRSDWYTGTANAIYQNASFVERFSPEHLLILSGDHIYQMDYSRLLERHCAAGADCTISVVEVPWEEASRFGVLTADQNGRITAFAEKPAEPQSNLASMGVYLFRWKKLMEYLERDARDTDSDHDFGKNIIPRMIEEHQAVYGLRFDGYWKDVGTILSLWQANMDLLDNPGVIGPEDSARRIYARTLCSSPHYLDPDADISHSLITGGCEVAGKIRRSVLFTGAQVEEGSQVVGSLVMPGAAVRKGASVFYAIVAENAVIGENAIVGAIPKNEARIGKNQLTVIGEGVQIEAGAVIGAGEVIERQEDKGGMVG